MKTRNGFVSNSSSTSFIVLLPKNFKPDFDCDKVKGALKEINAEALLYVDYVDQTPIGKKDLINVYNELLAHGHYSGRFIYLFKEILGDYVIASVQTSAHASSIYLVDMKKVDKILKEQQ